MTIDKKWLCIGSLIVAGLLSLVLSFFGGFGLLWSGFLQKNHSPLLLAFFLPYLFAFPLFALSAGVTKIASIGLWASLPIHWFAMMQMQSPSPGAGFSEFLGTVALALYSSIGLIILAVLVQLGTYFYEFTHDERWVKWKVSKNEVAT